MKKLFILLFSVLLLGSITLQAQVYDGITQPTRWRIWFPAQFSVAPSKTTTPTVAPFVGYKVELAKWVNLTAVYQYNVNKHAHIPAIWMNFNINKKVYFLFRTGYNSQANQLFETVSGTWKAPMNFMLDFTWQNMIVNNFNEGAAKGTQVWETYDNLQVLGGWKLTVNKRDILVVNTGWRFRQEYVGGKYNAGLISNLRLIVYQKNWLQFGYDYTNRLLTAAAVIQFDNFTDKVKK